MEGSKPFRLFGDLVLDALGSKTLLASKLERIQPYITDLENTQSSGKTSQWNRLEAFETAARAEVAAWKSHGQQRDQRFLIPPDGPIEARLACHLHNPNFNVADPYTSQGADHSNPSIKQVLSAGFTPDKVLFYDHTFRRDPVNGIAAYPPKVLQIHEDFTSELRQNMAASVDVVWGAPVRERMKKTHRLEELQLWGQYRGVSVFLEWDKAGSRLLRFVVFVCHPEAMVYGEPETLGRKQDLHLQAASKLAKIDICDNFYERIFRPTGHKFLSGAQLAQRNILNVKAIEQLESVAYRSKAPTDGGPRKRRRVPLVERMRLRRYPGLLEEIEKKDKEAAECLDNELEAMDATVEERENHTVPSFHVHPEIEADLAGPRWLKMLATSLAEYSSSDNKDADAMRLCHTLAEGEFDLPGVSTWNDLPRTLRVWMETQDGLKVGGRPIASTQDLLEVHGLILKRPPIFEEHHETSITKVVLQVVARYYRLLECAARDSSINHLTIRRTISVPLKCSRCKSRAGRSMA